MKLCWDAVWLESFYLFKTLENWQKENPHFQWFHVTKYNNKIKQQYKETVSSWYNFHYNYISDWVGSCTITSFCVAAGWQTPASFQSFFSIIGLILFKFSSFNHQMFCGIPWLKELGCRQLLSFSTANILNIIHLPTWCFPCVFLSFPLVLNWLAYHHLIKIMHEEGFLYNTWWCCRHLFVW